MRITVTIDDGLSDLFREAIETFVRVQAARRLVSLGGAAPDMAEIPRRPSEPAD